MQEVEDKISEAIALGGTRVVRIEGYPALSYHVLEMLKEHPQITLVSEFTYDGLDYRITIPGSAVELDPSIKWYGPKYLFPMFYKYGTDTQPAVQAYLDMAAHKSDLERTDLAKDKTGVFSGSYAVNPFTGDNIPIWSYLRLGGKCRVCGMRIPPRYFIMEVLTGLLYAGAVAKTGWSGENPETLALYIVLLSLALTTFQIDWKCRIIPDVTTYPAMAAGLLVGGLLPGAFARGTWQAGLLFSGIGLAAAGIFLALFALIGRKVAGQEVFGWGDVKYMMAAGALTGLPGAVFILTLGSLLGVLFGLYVGFRRWRRGRPWRGVHIPLGVFLALASAVWVFAGDWILRWYLQLWVG